MSDSDYVAIRVSTLRGDLKIPFNAYLQIAGKFILFCREGDSFEGERLDRLKAKNLKKLYVPAEQTEAYKTYIRQNLNLAFNESKDRPLDLRAQIIHGAVQAAADDLMDNPSNSAIYSVALEASRRFMQFIFSEDTVLKTILEIKNTDFSISHHGVDVAALTLAICKEMQLPEEHPKQMEALTLGCLMHDLGHVYNNINFTVPFSQLSQQEQAIFVKHTQEGLSRLDKLPFYDQLTLDVIQQHEEMTDATGPLKMKEKDISPIIKAVATANQFDHLILYEQMSPKDALKKLFIEKIGALSLETMRALQETLKRHGVI